MPQAVNITAEEVPGILLHLRKAHGIEIFKPIAAATEVTETTVRRWYRQTTKPRFDQLRLLELYILSENLDLSGVARSGL